MKKLNPQNKNYGSYKLHSLISVYTTEMIAILKALQYVNNKNIDKPILITYSRSLVEKLKSLNFKSQINLSIVKI